MPAIIVKPEGGAPPSNAAKDGDYYDRCPADGCIEVERSHKAGGRDGHGEEHLDYSIFSADRRKGGCGHAWARTTKQGAATVAKHRKPLHLTAAAAADRQYIDLGSSDAYRAGYDAIDWSRK